MLKNLSLRARLNLLLGALLLLSLIVNMALIGWHAGPRIRAENESDEKLARGLIYTVLESLQDAPDPGPLLQRLISNLGNLRHVRIVLAPHGAQAATVPSINTANTADRPPHWFVRLFVPRPRLSIIPAVLKGKNFGDIVLVSDPTQEVAEIWTEIGSIIETALLLGICVLVFIMLLVGRALAPIAHVGQAITRLAAGDTSVKLVPQGPPEFVDIGAKINDLAVNLAKVNAENHRLIQQMMKVQEDERSQIARDLHDEMGPHLFWIRANVSALREKPDPARVNQTVAAIGEQAEAIQSLLRRLLQRLRPAGLDELGLAEALRALVASWRAAHPELEIILDASEDFTAIDENIGLAAYRVIQEGLTNVFRHAGATKVIVTVAYVANDDGERAALGACVEDDGIGLPEQFQKGLGLTGMSERVRACGGRLSITSRAGGGTLIEAIFPLEPANQPVLEPT